MTIELMLRILDENNIPKTANMLSNSGWECNATEMNGIYYNDSTNTLMFTQGDFGETGCGYKGFRCLYREELQNN